MECSLENIDNNLCISCNIAQNYYPFFNETNYNNDANINIHCYNETFEGFFINYKNKRYEECYKTCKYCYGHGNESFHNCSECNLDYKYMNGVNCYKNYSYYFYKDSENKYYSTNSSECPENYKLIEDNKECIDNCSKNDTYPFEFNNRCYNSCPFGSNSSEKDPYLCECKIYYDNNTSQCINEIPDGYYLIDKTLEACNEKCLKCSFESMSQNNLCLTCNISKGYYPLLDENINNNKFYECYNSSYVPYGYYFKNDSYILDKRCDKFEEFNFNEIFSSSNPNLSYFNCPKYYYCDSLNHYFCTVHEICPDKYPKLIANKKKCVENCQNDTKYKYEYNNICYESCPNGTNYTSNNIYLCEDI